MPPTSHDVVKRDLIAAVIRNRIATGEYAITAPLPSEIRLSEEFGVARGTVQKALEMLRDEGLVQTRPRKGTFPLPMRPKRRIELTRYQDELDHALTDLQSALDPTGLPTASVTDSTADQTLADLFKRPVGTRLVRRDWVISIDGVPVQMTTSYLPADLVESTHGRLGSAGGVVAYLISTDHRPTDVFESTVARPPTDYESTVLGVGSGWVLATTRQIFAGDTVVEVGREIVAPAQGTEIVHRIQLRWPTRS